MPTDFHASQFYMKGGDTMKVIAPVSDLLGRCGKRRNPFIVYWFSGLFHMKGGDIHG